MKINNIKNILAAVIIMMFSDVLPTAADTKNAYDYVKLLTNGKITPGNCYIDFQYPDKDYDGNDDAIRNVKIFLGYNENDGYGRREVCMAKMDRCQDHMFRYYTEWGAFQILSSSGNPLRIVKVRYYPSERAMKDGTDIRFFGRWDIDDNGKDTQKGPDDYDVNVTMNITSLLNGGKFDSSQSQKGSFDYYGNRKYTVKNYWASFPSGWENRMRFNETNDFFSGVNYIDKNYAEGNHDFTADYLKNKSIYGWNYIRKTISVKNGSYEASEGNVNVVQTMYASNPIKMDKNDVFSIQYESDITYDYNYLGKPVFHFSVKHPGDQVIVFRGDNHEYVTTVDLNNNNVYWTDDNKDPFSSIYYYFVNRKKHWSGHEFIEELKFNSYYREISTRFNGEGTEASPYVLLAYDDMKQMAYNVNNGREKGKFWTVNGNFTIENDFSSVGCEANPFDGHLDGYGHTITMYLDGNNVNKMSIFGFTRNAEIKNLKVMGSVKASCKFGAGIISRMFGGSISDCWSDVTISSTVNGDGTHGGFAGTTEETTQKCVIKDCVFTGEINGVYTHSCGGFAGWSNKGTNTLRLVNCLNLGKLNVQTQGSDVFARNGAEIQNCYYLNAFGTNLTNATRLTDEHKSAALADKFGVGKYIYNNDYPKLKLFNDVNGLSPDPDLYISGNTYFRLNQKLDNVIVYFERAAETDKFSTLYLPFDVDAEKIAPLGTLYSFKEVYSSNGKIIFKEEKNGAKAYTPYLLKSSWSWKDIVFNGVTVLPDNSLNDASKAPATTQFVGTTKPVTAPTGAYGYAAGDATHARGSFVRVGNNVTLPAFCAYMWINGNAPKTMEAVFTDEDGDITGIETLYQDEENPTIYSLDGRKLDKPERGINIINGRKVVVK